MIGGNDDEGIRIDGDAADGNVIIGNYIGTDVTGTLNRGAGSDGILIRNSADNNRVGGTAAGEGNLVAFNDWGVSIAGDNTDGNAILGNTIRSNVQMGIELDPSAGNDTNDANDTDTNRPNLGQNFPVLTSAITNGSTVRIAGTLDGPVSSFFRIEFFANPTNDREGERYLGYVNVATPAGGADATFDVMFTAAVAVNEYVTATATRTTDATYSTFRDTSEFSVTRQVLAAGGRTVSGIVYEDVDADGVVTDPGTQRLAGVTVDLWADLLGTPTYIASVTTDANGAYSFIGLGNLVYGTAVRSTTITPTAGFNAGFDVGDVWADQTYAGRDGVYWSGGTYAFLGSAGALFGGMESPSGGTSDAGSPTNVLGYEHIIRTDLTGGVNRLDADFGFSFSTVTNARGDAGDDDAAADRVQQGSLRQFVLNSNAIAGVQAADFSIGGGGLQTITLAAGAPLANLSDAVLLDATTQEGFVATPLVELNGASAGAGASGFVLAAGSSGSRIEGFAINQFNWFGVLINGSSNNVVSGNFLGTDSSGTNPAANNTGLVIWGNSTGNTVGGTTAAERNVISGNAVDGIQFQGANVQNNVVIGNYIGLDRNGTADLGNANQGVAIFNSASGNTIGGTAPGAGNVVSGNNGEGIVIRGVGTTLNAVLGNYVGTNAAGTAAIGNGTVGGNGDGIQIDQGATNNVIGGASAAARNVISGNLDDAVEIKDAGTTGNRVLGNWIGLNAAGNNQRRKRRRRRGDLERRGRQLHRRHRRRRGQRHLRQHRHRGRAARHRYIEQSAPRQYDRPRPERDGAGLVRQRRRRGADPERRVEQFRRRQRSRRRQPDRRQHRQRRLHPRQQRQQHDPRQLDRHRSDRHGRSREHSARRPGRWRRRGGLQPDHNDRRGDPAGRSEYDSVQRRRRRRGDRRGAGGWHLG